MSNLKKLNSQYHHESEEDENFRDYSPVSGTAILTTRDVNTRDEEDDVSASLEDSMRSTNPLLVGIGYTHDETEGGDSMNQAQSNHHAYNRDHLGVGDDDSNSLKLSSNIFTSIPLNSPIPGTLEPSSKPKKKRKFPLRPLEQDEQDESLLAENKSPVYIHTKHFTQIDDKYLSYLNISKGIAQKKSNAAAYLKSGRKWLNRIILLQTIGNLIRALPIFILEKYYVMLLIFFQAIFYLLGLYGVKRIKHYLILLYIIGCLGTTFLEGATLLTYAKVSGESNRPFGESMFAFWCYVMFDVGLCILNLCGVYLGLKLFISIVTLLEEKTNNLIVFAAHLVGSFEEINPEEEEESQQQQAKNNRCIFFYGSDIKKAIATTISITKNLSIGESTKQQFKLWIAKWKNPPPKPNINSPRPPNKTMLNLTSSILQRSSVPTKTSSNLLNVTSNQVITSKYNVFTFFPKVIIYQFSRLANLYTLVIVVLCMFSFSPVGPVSSLTPLLVVIFVTAFKELMEDIKRHKQDNEINNRPTLIYKPPGSSHMGHFNLDSQEESTDFNIQDKGIFKESLWKDIMVGDIILVKNGDLLPADMICLSSSRSDGRTYLETANLDGETNLKVKNSISKCSWIKTPEDLDNFSCKVDYEAPTNDIYGFEGVLTILKSPTHIDINYVPVSIDQLLLRGTKLRNTDWVIGIVVYTGVDTKVEKNSTKVNQKRSSVERSVNSKLIILFLLQTIICIICSIGHNRWHLEGDKEAKPWYMGTFNTENDFIYVSYVILYNTMIPLSMYVSMEVIRVSNAHFIDSDLEMYDESTDTPAQARNTNINEELGQIQYLFSDKTGTLTCNEMKFHMCTIGGLVYGPDINSLSNLKSISQNQNQLSNQQTNTNEILSISSNLNNKEYFISTPLGNSTADLTLPINQNQFIKEFLTCLSICNTVIVEQPSHQDDNKSLTGNNANSSIPKYQASSPDEEALTNTAAKYGYILKSRDDNILTVSVNGKEEKFEILNILEFNSYRKRMSVIVRMPFTGQIRLYCKGADSVIFPRCKSIQTSSDQSIHAQTEQHLSQFASTGLRTLCMSVKIIEQEHYQTWSRIYQDASVSLVKKTEKVDAACELIETEMTLIGATGIEDRLQDQVPETIQALREAGIKIWVLTGDKQETAISIATTSSVLNQDMDLIILNEKTKDDLMKKLVEITNQKNFNPPSMKHEWRYKWMADLAWKLKLDASDAPRILKRSEDTLHDYKHIALVIDGATLQWALDKDLRYYFLQIAKACESVVCCRCSPSQKAKVVKLVSERSLLFGDGAATMSIGDGANDVPMIRGAHVGVGISGREGMQAVLASDFAIANFSMLQRLILVHGNRSYKRMVKLILYSFCKNIALSLTNYWFGFFSGFSGQMIYFDFLFTLYNALFTSLPVLNLGTFDQDVKEEELIQNPNLYRECQSNSPFSTSVFIGWLLNGIWQSAVIFFVSFWLLDTAMTDGKSLGMWGVGTAAYIYLVFTTNIQIAFITRYWVRITFFTVSASAIASILFCLIYSVVLSVEPDAFHIGFELLSTPNFWLLLILVPAIALLPYTLINLNTWLFSNDYYRKLYSKQSLIKMEKL